MTVFWLFYASFLSIITVHSLPIIQELLSRSQNYKQIKNDIMFSIDVYNKLSEKIWNSEVSFLEKKNRLKPVWWWHFITYHRLIDSAIWGNWRLRNVLYLLVKTKTGHLSPYLGSIGGRCKCSYRMIDIKYVIADSNTGQLLGPVMSSIPL